LNELTTTIATDFVYKGVHCTVAEYTRVYPESIKKDAKLMKMLTGSLPNPWYCGYVCIPEGHKWYDKKDDDIPIECHGGLTFASKLHVKESSNYDKFAVGVDYMHAYDDGGTLDEVKEECKKMVDQL
jgi:hypothetical protein